MHLKFRALDHIDGGDEAVYHERKGGTVIDGNGVGFAVYADSGFRATGDKDGLVYRGGQLDYLGRPIEMLDDPFVAVEVFACGFLSAHALWFGLFAREGRLSVQGGLGGGAGWCGGDGGIGT